MLASPVISDRRLSRSLHTTLAGTVSESPTVPPHFDTHDLLLQLQGLAAQLLPPGNKPISSSPIPQDFRDRAGQRRCYSEQNSSSREASGTCSPNLIADAVAAPECKALRHQAPANELTLSPTNDAPSASDPKSSCVRVPHELHSVTNKSSETNFVQPLTSQEKGPAQREWERLWYNGVSPAFSKIAHHFPELQCSNLNTSAGLSISEPTLAISSLRQEDRSIFEKEEQESSQFSFAPKSEQDRLRRLHRAQQATDHNQRLALLLGLPTFDEYISEKLQIERQSQKDNSQPSKRQLKREAKFTQKKENKRVAKTKCIQIESQPEEQGIASLPYTTFPVFTRGVMTHERKSSKESTPLVPAQHRPLVVGLTKPQTRSASTMASSSEAAALNKEIAENVKENTQEAAPSEDNPTAPATQKPKKEKAPKQPKPQKAAAVVAPTTPALIDLRVGHILRAIAHPNADSLYVSTIAMGDPEGTEHTQVDEETGKVVRTVCSGLNGLVPLEEMQNRKIVVVANLKPVNMRSIKSAAMVLAASPKQPEGADPHAADRVVELVTPPEGSEAGDKVYFEGWPYGEGKGPEKVLNPKKKQWEAIQPGFYTSDDLVVGFDASVCEEVEGSDKGKLVVNGKGPCTVKTLKGAVVR